MDQFNCVSLFSGAGGLDIGFERAGFRTISMCEIEEKFHKSLLKNQGWKHHDGYCYFNDTKIINNDIRNLTGETLSLGQQVDLVIGGPPCQSFSSAGKQRSILDSRGLLVEEFIRIVSEISPRAFLFENVRGLVTARDASGTPGAVIKKIHSSFQSLGYSCRAGLLNSADYGSCQRRVRCFIVGVKNGEAPCFPLPTHYDNKGKEVSLFLAPRKSLEEFLDNYADKNEENYVYPTEALGRQLKNISNGSGVKSKGKPEPTRPEGHWGYRQGTFIADLKKPARTVTGSSSQDWIRWDEKLRRLTLLEVKRLQGFPVDWNFCGTKAQIFKQIGNAVPVCFGELLGKSIQQHLLCGHKEKSVPIELPNKFHSYISYTKKDHEKNKSARSIHHHFNKMMVTESNR